MRPLLLSFGLFGLVLGLAAAVALHSLPAVLVGAFGWFAYTPLASVGSATPRGQVDVSIDLQWAPSLLSLGGLGLASGLVVAVVLGRLGWRLSRSPR